MFTRLVVLLIFFVTFSDKFSAAHAKEMQAKLDEVRAGMQSMMTDWRKEWQEAATKWSEEIRIVTGTRKESEYVVLPTNTEPWNNYWLLECDQKTLVPTSSNPVYDLGDAANYYTKAGKDLTKIPINLAIDIFRYVLLSFGGSIFETSAFQNERYFIQYLCMDEENKRHHEIIRKSLPTVYGHTKLADQASTPCEVGDRWIPVFKRGIQLGGKLRSSHYIEDVIRHLLEYQTGQMIEYHFLKRGKQTIDAAKKFFKSLSNTTLGTIDTVAGAYNLHLINVVNDLSNCNREKMKMFNLEDEKDPRHNWFQALADPYFVANLRVNNSDNNSNNNSNGVDGDKLTVADVRFLICWCIDAKYDREESLQKIETIESSTASGFPAITDDFSNFDPGRLRGILAETVLSKKLAIYTLGIKEISEGKFAEVAPAALTEIVGSYYPVDIS